MNEDTTTTEEIGVNELSVSIKHKATSLSNLMFNIRDCAMETLPEGMKSLHEPFEEEGISATEVESRLSRVDTMLERSLELLRMFTPEAFDFEKEVTKTMDIELSALCQYQIKAFSEETADDINDGLPEEDIMERADVETPDSYMISAGHDWSCDSLD
jgi:hypothetical protein